MEYFLAKKCWRVGLLLSLLLYICAREADENKYCEYDPSLPLCGGQCRCRCSYVIWCEDGPPYTPPDNSTNSTDVSLTLAGKGHPSNQVKVLNVKWSINLTIVHPHRPENYWGQTELLQPDKTLTPESLALLGEIGVHIVIEDMPLLEVIKANTFDPVSWLIKSLSISGCPKLLTIQPKIKFPAYSFCRLESFRLRSCDSIKEVSFLNSVYYNKQCNDKTTPARFAVDLYDLPGLTSLGLWKSWQLNDNTALDLNVTNTPLLTDGFTICHHRLIMNLNSTISLTGDPAACSSCNLIWLQVWSRKTWFTNTNEYPLPPQDSSVRISHDIDNGTCNTALLNADNCKFSQRWDPFYIHHHCHKSNKVWKSCLNGCLCNHKKVRCVDGPYYDRNTRRIYITGEDFPNLHQLDELTFKNVTETSVETFYFYKLAKLTAVAVNTKKFDAEVVKNVVVSKCPYLEVFRNFVRPNWINLEHLEFSYMGKQFGKNIYKVFRPIFKHPRPELRVLDLTAAHLTWLPRWNYLILAPNLRYLLLSGNKFTHLDIDVLFPFYSLPSKVDSMPAMLLERTTTEFSKELFQTKTLNILSNRLLRCDCRMSLEHLSRVQDVRYWEPSQVTYVMMDKHCRPANSTEGCDVSQSNVTSCVYVNYEYNGEPGVATDKPCTSSMSAYSFEAERRLAIKGTNCSRAASQFCSQPYLGSRDYPYYSCNADTELCTPVSVNDPLIPPLTCTNDTDCNEFQLEYLQCPGRPSRPGKNKCSESILECNTFHKVCQFKPPYSRKQFKKDMCVAHLSTISRSYLDPEDRALAKRAWVGDCGFRCKSNEQCKQLSADQHFKGMRFCCGSDGFCSTNCLDNCLPGFTGRLCETSLTAIPLVCPLGWGGPQCSVKLCNKFFHCANGGKCVKNRCECTNDFSGPECTSPRVCLEDGLCLDTPNSYCESKKITTGDSSAYQCTVVSDLFFKYRYLRSSPSDGYPTTSRVCDEKECQEMMPNSKCINNECGCMVGSVAYKVRNKQPVCVPGPVPCSTSGECTTLHPEMVCSANKDYILKVERRPVPYTSYCLCSDPGLFSTSTGACRDQRNQTAQFGFLTVGELDETMSIALIAIIGLVVVGVGVVIGMFVTIRRRSALEEDNSKLKREPSRANQLHSQLEMLKADK